MRLTSVVSNQFSQNQSLRVLCVSLMVVNLCLALGIVKFSFMEALVIERGNGVSTIALQANDRKPTRIEIQNFVRNVLPHRFESDLEPEPSQFSQSEIAFRNQEQKSLESQQLHQKILIRGIEVSSNGVVKVELDRVISTKRLRSALALSLELEIVRVARSPQNPYGLKIDRVKQIQIEEGNEQ